MKLSKNTVRKYLRSSDPPQFKARQYERMLDGYEDRIKEMIGNRYIGTRIYSELMGMGYEGSLSTVHRYIRETRSQEEINSKITTRVETAPGKQMQYDWKGWDIPVSGKAVKVYIHEVVLSFSRKKHYCCSLSITTGDIVRAIIEAISYFGGLTEELVIDNPKQMVITHTRDDVVRYNDEFLRFCGLYGIEPNPCQNYRARTKGKAERPFYYIQEHLLRGIEVNELCEFDVLLRGFTEKYNKRPHSSLKESPDDRFNKEKGYLRDIPLIEPAVLYKRELKKVSNDGYISWDGGLYPVPMHLCLRDVMVEAVFGKTLKVYDKGVVVVEHQKRLFDKDIRPEHPEHEGLNRGFVEKKDARRSEIVNRFIEAFGDKGRLYIKGLKKAVSANLYWHLKEIEGYTELYGISKVLDAIDKCISIGTYHKNSVKRLLIPLPISQHNPVNTPLANLMLPAGDTKRGLSAYRVEVSHE